MTMGPESFPMMVRHELETFAPLLLRGSAVGAAFLVLAFVVRRLVQRLARDLQKDRSVILLVSQLAFYTLLAVGLITGLGTMGVNTSALVASLGLGGFALGFALRDAISNLLAGVLVLLYHPFRLGQRITVAGFDGLVQEINLRYTVLSTDDTQQLIPNQMLFTNPITVHRRPASS